LWLTAISTDLRNAVRQEVEGLRTSIDERTAALEALVSQNDELFDQLTRKVHDLSVEEIQAAATAARQQAEAAAQADLSAAQARLQGQFDSARAEFEAIRTTLETQLAETERDITAIRRKRDDHAASLDEARGRINTLEETNAEAGRVRQLAEARLEEEVQRRTTVAKQLEAACQEIQLAKAEGDSCRLEAQLAAERATALENRLLQMEQAAAHTRTASAIDGDRHLVLQHLKKGLDDLARAKSEEILSRLVGHLGECFAACAVFTVEGQRLKLWKGRDGEAAAAANAIPELSLESDSPLARAFKHRSAVSVDGSEADGAVGLWETPLGNAIALPVLAYGRVVALAYGENPPGHSDDRVLVLETIAEILVGCVNQRLNRNPLPADLQSVPAPAIDPSVATEADRDVVSRRARRVKIDPPVEILLDGAASTLVDVSALGAQVVSPVCLRPNRRVQIVLPHGAESITCQGRIVWARLERPRAEFPALYRAGLRFADADPQTILAFISQHSAAEVSR